jgi:hypothetical protein
VKGEDRLTTKTTAAAVLPKIAEAREVLTSHLASLRYLWVKVDKKSEDQFSMDTFALYGIEQRLRTMEDELCQV